MRVTDLRLDAWNQKKAARRRPSIKERFPSGRAAAQRNTEKRRETEQHQRSRLGNLQLAADFPAGRERRVNVDVGETVAHVVDQRSGRTGRGAAAETVEEAGGVDRRIGQIEDSVDDAGGGAERKPSKAGEAHGHGS